MSSGMGAGDPVPIPEPMVFDLVRPLGAEQGELEVNALAILPFRGADPTGTQFAPEIEYAVRDGLAVEFELPFRDGDLEAVKLAGQWTFGARPARGFIHGTQLIAERLVDDDAWDVSLLYIPAWRLENRWSVLAMAGVTTLFGSDVDDDVGAIVNANLFKELDRRWVFGLEVDSVLLSDEGSSVLVMPQLHHEFNERVTIQFGVGAQYYSGRAPGPTLLPPESSANGWFGQASFRLILEF